ncbi:MAG: DNA recombination protein RmuC [Phycisphaera sp.]|nr:DNA recombination protein RmuC [Phycisphaera sp.]
MTMLYALIASLMVLFGVALLTLRFYIKLNATQSTLVNTTDQLEQTQRDLAQREQAIEGYTDKIEAQAVELSNTRIDLATAHEKIAGFDRRVMEIEAQHKQAQQQAREAFDSLAQKALTQANEQFLQLARKTFDGEQKDAQAQLDQRKQAIEELLKPIRESLDKHAKAVGDMEKEREGAYRALRQQVTSLSEEQEKLRGETANLVKALRRPEVRGRWGELAIERVLELAGLTSYCHDSQVTSPDGTLRADKVVQLPRERCIVIDVKTPIDAYLSANETSDETQRQVHLDRHVRQIEDKVKELSSKRYQDHYPTADLIVMFIPGEAFLQAAVERKKDLLEKAMEQSVIIASPTTLVPMLKTVALGWREEKIAENARHVSDLGKDLHSRIATALGHLDKLGKSIDSTLKNYNNLVGSVERQVLPQARKFKELGADSPKELPAEINPIEETPRPLNAPEMDASNTP